MSYLHIDHIDHAYGRHQVLFDCSFQMEEGQILSLLGESGSGKTTMLRLIAGFERPKKGAIHIAGDALADDSTFILPEHRDIGLVFQDYALFPHLTVEKNLKLAQKKGDSTDIRAWLKAVGLEGMESRKPDQLSGGQQQRVAIARALAARPKLLLLDEPFSNIDESLKFSFRTELKEILKKQSISAIFVTHDTKDALAIADKVVILKDGEIRQSASPEDIYRTPSDRYVAGLLGPYNVVQEHNDACTIIRAEHVRVDDQGAHQGEVKQCLFQGEQYLLIASSNNQEWVVCSNTAHAPGNTIRFRASEENQLKVSNR
ncbi:ABC transporter ATP-binding protein [Sanyastnella coralliicola]|uniref:ABC transporter ATP-binding protein n=1 Tax=Sanyastnella coralliicola TaxID=3069118 RepID=UPI0027BAFF8D|nr:ABC transporter ATP-binding protein [Longitalea sp. SCSIO 12813]